MRRSETYRLQFTSGFGVVPLCQSSKAGSKTSTQYSFERSTWTMKSMSRSASKNQEREETKLRPRPHQLYRDTSKMSADFLDVFPFFLPFATRWSATAWLKPSAFFQTWPVSHVDCSEIEVLLWSKNRNCQRSRLLISGKRQYEASKNFIIVIYNLLILTFCESKRAVTDESTPPDIATTTSREEKAEMSVFSPFSV